MAAPRLASLYDFLKNQGYFVESKKVELRIVSELDVGAIHIKLGPAGVEVSIWIDSAHEDLIAQLKEAFPEIEVKSYEPSDW